MKENYYLTNHYIIGRIYLKSLKELNLKFKGEEQKNKEADLKKREKELQIRSEEQNRKDVDLKVISLFTSSSSSLLSG